MGGSAAEVAAPLFYVSPQQINFQMPVEAAGASVTVTVVAGGVRSEPLRVTLLPRGWAAPTRCC